MPRQRVGASARAAPRRGTTRCGSSPGRRARRRAGRRPGAGRSPRGGSRRSARRAGARARARPPPRAGSAPPRRRRGRGPAARPARGSGWTRRRRSRWSWIPGVRVAGISADEAPQGRERLLDAAVRLIAREGIDNVRIARIATEAGVSAGLVHYHFASRDALLEEALEHSYERAGDLRLAALEEGRATAGAAPGGDDRPVPAHRSRAARRLRAVGRAVAAQRPRPGAAAGRRPPLRAPARVVRAGDGRRRRERRAARLRRRADGRPPAGAHRRLRHPRAHRRSAACRSSARAPRSGRRSRATSACPRRRALIAAALRARCRSAAAARRPRRRRPPSRRR